MRKMRGLWSDPSFLALLPKKNIGLRNFEQAAQDLDDLKPLTDKSTLFAGPAGPEGGADKGPTAPQSNRAAKGMLPADKAPADKVPADTPPAGKKPATDETNLRCDTAAVMDKDGNDEGLPQSGEEYDFYVLVYNTGKVPAGKFFVRFTLTGDVDFEKDDVHDEGIKPGDHVTAKVPFGKFKEGADCALKACVYSQEDPDKPIHCGEFMHIVATKRGFD